MASLSPVEGEVGPEHLGVLLRVHGKAHHQVREEAARGRGERLQDFLFLFFFIYVSCPPNHFT